MLIAFIAFAVIVVAVLGGAISFAIEHPFISLGVVAALVALGFVYKAEHEANNADKVMSIYAPAHRQAGSVVDDSTFAGCDLTDATTAGVTPCPIEVQSQTTFSREGDEYVYSTRMQLTNRSASRGAVITVSDPLLSESPEVSPISSEVVESTCDHEITGVSSDHRLVLAPGASASCSFRTRTFGTDRTGYMYQRSGQHPTGMRLAVLWGVERLRSARYLYQTYTVVETAYNTASEEGLPLDDKS